jgi:hypothetical protein
MKPDEYADLLNLLLECERAGAKLLAAYMEELPPGAGALDALRSVQRDEARNCAVLIHHLLEAGAAPSPTTGEFYQKGLAIRGWSERLEFLNRGQAWVARRIGEALPRIAPSPARAALQEMYDAHLANIARCDGLQEETRLAG